MEFDEVGVGQRRRGGATPTLTWTDVERVSLVVTAGSPVGDTGCWLLVGASGAVCVIPLGRAAEELVEWLGRLAGFEQTAPSATHHSLGAIEYLWWLRDAEQPDELASSDL
jgi:hypothetical protein